MSPAPEFSVGLDVRGSRVTPLRHLVVIWAVLFGVLVGAFAFTVLAVNSTVFSASGFVSSYLQALQRGDVDEVLSTPGVGTVSGVSNRLLGADAFGLLGEITILSDVDQGGGLHLVEYSATLDGVPASGTFQVLKGENRFGVFSSWTFLRSPISILRVTPMHDPSFAVNDIPLVSATGASVATTFQVFTPSAFTVTHSSTYLTATPLSATVTEPGSTVPMILDIRASHSFVESMQTQMNEYLDECTSQEVLFPTGCPFGQELSNRVESIPTWSMPDYPTVTVEPGNDPGTWVVPEAQGAAHLIVDVRSLFDGTLSTFDEDVPFGISWVMTFQGDRIVVQK